MAEARTDSDNNGLFRLNALLNAGTSINLTTGRVTNSSRGQIVDLGEMMQRLSMRPASVMAARRPSPPGRYNSSPPRQYPSSPRMAGHLLMGSFGGRVGPIGAQPVGSIGPPSTYNLSPSPPSGMGRQQRNDAGRSHKCSFCQSNLTRSSQYVPKLPLADPASAPLLLLLHCHRVMIITIIIHIL